MPDLVEAYVQTGDVYAYQVKLKEAAAQYRRAIAIDPNYQPAYAQLFWVLDWAGDHAGAIKPGMTAIRLNPQDASAKANLANVYLNLKDYKNALDLAQKAVDTDPSLPIAHENVGEALAGLGRIKEARDEWEKVLTLSPTKGLEGVARKMLAKYPE